jgi:hypothetical protein
MVGLDSTMLFTGLMDITSYSLDSVSVGFNGGDS